MYQCQLLGCDCTIVVLDVTTGEKLGQWHKGSLFFLQLHVSLQLSQSKTFENTFPMSRFKTKKKHVPVWTINYMLILVIISNTKWLWKLLLLHLHTAVDKEKSGEWGTAHRGKFWRLIPIFRVTHEVSRVPVRVSCSWGKAIKKLIGKRREEKRGLAIPLWFLANEFSWHAGETVMIGLLVFPTL